MKKKYHPKKFSFHKHKKIFFIIFIIFLLPIIFWASQYPQLTSSEGKTVTEKLSPLSVTRNAYGSIDPIDKYPVNDPIPENHPDINLTIRGHVPTTGAKYPLVLGEVGDPKAPQIWKILRQRPSIVSLYRINSWNWTTNKRGPAMPLPDDPGASFKQVQMVGFATTVGEEIYVPQSGYKIGGEYQVMVIFADDNSITIKYGREDNIGIKFGYAIQIEEIDVDPNLFALYRELNETGRKELPSLFGGQVLGTAKNTEIRVAIRDTGDFLDPRSKLDWWVGVDYPIPTGEPVIPTTLPIPTNPPVISTPTTYNLQPTILQPTTSPSITLPVNPQPTTFIPQPTIFIPTSTPIPTDTLTPTPTPLFDIGKTIKSASSFWSIIIYRLTQLSKIILP